MCLASQLAKCTAERLNWAFDKKDVRTVLEIIPDGKEAWERAEPEVLAELAIKIYGHGLLLEVRWRQILLETLGFELVEKLAVDYTTRAFSDLSIDARNIASMPWRPRSTLVSIFREYLGIDESWLPVAPMRVPAIEQVEPIDAYSELFDYQDELVEEAFRRFESGENRLLVQLPTGAGKTRCAIAILVKLMSVENKAGRKAFWWLAHSEELIEQALSTFKKVWIHRGTERIEIVRFYGSYSPAKDSLENAVVFASIQKIARARGRSFQDLHDSIDGSVALVLDEAHRGVATTYKKAIDHLIMGTSAKLLGLTATPGRSGAETEAETDELARMFDRNLVTVKLDGHPIAALRKQGILAEVLHETIESGINISDGEKIFDREDSDIPRKIITRLARSTERNRLILKCIEQEASDGHQIVVFACSREHGRLLTAAVSVKGVNAVYLDYEMSRTDRRRAIEDFNSGKVRVLMNYGILSTGFDSPAVSVVIITRPTSSPVLYGQMLGRALRGPRVGGGRQCKIIDVRDNLDAYGGAENVYSMFNDYWLPSNALIVPAVQQKD